MFENLTDRLSNTVRKLRGQARLTEDNIKEALREVRIALLEADVALPVVQDFIQRVRERAVGTEVLKSLNPGQMLVKVVQEELTRIMGEGTAGLNLQQVPPVVILMAGLQGAGKTTTSAKLARHLIEQKKKVMLVSADIYRPAAIDQLQTLAGQVGAVFQPSSPEQQPVEIVQQAVEQARRQGVDVLIVDTAGRLHVDEVMMREIRQIHQAVNPAETLFVVDAMTGQDAANTAKAFGEALPLTGVVLTKTDGDARGGAALSVRQITGAPIKFIGAGEKVDALEPFHPDRMASRILGMGDVLSLVEEVQRKVDMEKAQKLANKVSKGKTFTLEDYRDQLMQMQNLGGLGALMDKLPGMGQLPDQVMNKVGDEQTKKHLAIINSMTPKERRFPDLMSRGSRKKRVARGSGTSIQDVNRMLKQFGQMQKMMKKFSKGGMKSMMKKLKGKMPGGMPPGGMPPGGMPPGGFPF